jgi:predicted lipoprotein with Yx(FWY)xxD motif
VKVRLWTSGSARAEPVILPSAMCSTALAAIERQLPQVLTRNRVRGKRGNKPAPCTFFVDRDFLRREFMHQQPRTYAAIAALVLIGAPASAQNAASVKIAESTEHGRYLTDADGRALYLFESDTQGQGGTKARVSCTGECLDRWPPLYSEGEPRAGEMADAAKLGTAGHEGKMIVTYNGWPLYRFVEDTGPGETKGHDIEEFGAEWYLVTPDGEKAED